MICWIRNQVLAVVETTQMERVVRGNKNLISSGASGRYRTTQRSVQEEDLSRKAQDNHNQKVGSGKTFCNLVEMSQKGKSSDTMSLL